MVDSIVRVRRPQRSSRNAEWSPTPAPTTGCATWSSRVARLVSTPRQSPAYRQMSEPGPGMAPLGEAPAEEGPVRRVSRSVMYPYLPIH
jgi:hypothetical protein